MTIAYIRSLNKDIDTSIYEGRANKIIIEAVSANASRQPKLDGLINDVKAGDIIIVEQLSHIAADLHDIVLLVRKLDERGVELRSRKEGFRTRNEAGQIMVQLLYNLYQFEKDVIVDKARDGRTVAIINGKKVGRPKKELEGFEEIYQDWFNGTISAGEAAKRLKITRTTWYSRAAEYGDNKIIEELF